MESLYQRLDPQAMVDDQVDLDAEDKSRYDSYEDELQNVETFPILDVKKRFISQYRRSESSC